MLSIFLFALCTVIVNAQEMPQAPMKWGKIPTNDLKMKVYKPDSSASAVVLCDYGVTQFENLHVVTRRHVRIKILKKPGYKWATVRIPYYAKDRLEYVTGIKGATYNINSKGEIITTKLNHRDIYDEKFSDKFRDIRFTLPQLKPGCVIEYEYKLYSSNPEIIKDWSFQRAIPTRWSEYRFEMPHMFHYMHIFTGWVPLSASTGTVSENAGYAVFGSDSNIPQVQIDNYRWVVKNAPAVRDEPYITTTDDYIDKIHLQLAEYRLPNMSLIKVLGTWDKVADGLLSAGDFGKALYAQNHTKALAHELTDSIRDTLEKAKRLYRYVRNHFTWNGNGGIFVDAKPDNLLKHKTGNDATLSMTLTYMLREVGIKADPVVLSTRDNGYLITQYPLAEQFNRVITMAEINGKQFLLDPTDPFRPFGLLDPNDLNGKGLVVVKKTRFISLKPKVGSLNMSYINADLDSNGQISGSVNLQFAGQAAVFVRNDLAGKTEVDKYVNSNLLDSFSNGHVDSIKINNKSDINKNLSVSAQFKDGEQVQKAGNMMYVKTTLVDGFDNNPFKLKHRSFPVDFNYPITKTYVLNLKIPRGYTLSESPKNIIVRLPQNMAFFKRLVQSKGKAIMIYSRFSITKRHFNPNMYIYLRKFFAKVVSCENEMLVLKKSTP